MSTKILMVCLGNICRSPLAEGILKSKLPQENFLVDSAGTGNWHVGNPPDTRSIAVARNHQINIKDQKCRQIRLEDFEIFDHIYVMDNSNYDDVIALTDNSNHHKKVKLILNELFPDENVDVPDPYYGHENGFENVFQMLDKACEIIANNLLAKTTK